MAESTRESLMTNTNIWVDRSKGDLLLKMIRRVDFGPNLIFDIVEDGDKVMIRAALRSNPMKEKLSEENLLKIIYYVSGFRDALG